MVAALPAALAQGLRSDVWPYHGKIEYVATAAPGRYRAEIVSSRELFGKPLAPVRAAQEKTGSSVCYNGGFFEPDGSPSGLYMRKGKLVKPFTEGKGYGILYTDRFGNIKIGFRNEFERSNASDAMQFTLLRRGSPQYTHNEKANLLPMNLMGTTLAGSFVGMFFEPTNYTLADLHMVGDHRCISVGAMDEGTSASVHDSLGRHFGSERPVANFLAVYRL